MPESWSNTVNGGLPNWVLAVALILIGALSCFAGLRLFKLFLVLIGAILGAVLGFTLGFELGGRLVGVILALVGAVAGGCGLYFSFILGLFVFGGSLLALGALALLHIALPGLQIALGCVAFIVGGFLAVLLGKFAIIVGTSIEGAAALVLGVTSLTLGQPVADSVDALLTGALFQSIAQRRLWAVIALVGFLALLAAGMYVQLTCPPPKGLST